MSELKWVVKFSKLKFFFTIFSTVDKLSVFIAEKLIYFLEDFLGHEVYFDAPKISHSSDISPENQHVLNFLKEKNIIEEFGFGPNYTDEPKLFQFSIHTKGVLQKEKGDWCGGHSLANLNEAVSRAISEAFERYSLCVWSEKDLTRGSYSELESRRAVNPEVFVGISTENREEDENSIFGWTDARDLLSGQKVFVPSQLIYLTYPKINEPVLYLTNTTGAACSFSFEEASYRGLCETIERDAWMITYYNKISPSIIDLNYTSKFQNPALIKLLNLFKRYKLEAYAVDMTTDIKVPSVLGIVKDKFSSGRFGIGAKTDLNIEEAILGALMEAQKNRLWVRTHPDQDFNENKIIQSLNEKGQDLIQRTRFWNIPGKINNLEFLWQGSKRNIDIYKSWDTEISAKERLSLVLNMLKENSCDIYAKEVTIPEAKKLGFCVVKTLVPQLQPMHLHEAQPFFGGQRLYSVPVKLGYFNKPKTIDELNKLPHPFA